MFVGVFVLFCFVFVPEINQKPCVSAWMGQDEIVRLQRIPRHRHALNFVGFFMNRLEMGYMTEFNCSSSVSARIRSILLIIEFKCFVVSTCMSTCRDSPLGIPFVRSILHQLALVLSVLSFFFSDRQSVQKTIVY